MDEFVDELLTEERVCDIILPRLTRRDVLEEVERLPKRKSPLDVEEDTDDNKRYISRSPSPTSDNERYISRSPSPTSDNERYISRSPSPNNSDNERYISTSPTPHNSDNDDNERYISRSPSPIEE